MKLADQTLESQSQAEQSNASSAMEDVKAKTMWSTKRYLATS